MEWIMNALANVVLEALNDMLLWTTQLMTGFQLNIGTGEAAKTAANVAGPQQGSLFESTFTVSDFQKPFLVLAMFIVIMTAVLKLYQSMGGPFTQSEEPGVIAIRTIFAGVGVTLSYQIFVLVEKGFNKLYQNFVGVYTGLSQEFNSGSWLPSAEEREQAQQTLNSLPQSLQGRNNPVSGDQALQAAKTATGQSEDVFNLFGGDSLINPDNAGNITLGLVIIQVIIGCTLMICLFRLVLECYERYVVIGVMYITAPLAFSTMVSKQSQVFRNWCIMLVCQFILMCTNLLFIGGFMGAWFNIYKNLQSTGYVFESSQQYLTTMFIMIGWLLAGQKMDEYLRSLGLSAAQTGSGIYGALAGGAGVAMTAFRTANSAGRVAAKGVQSATKGVSKVSDGIFGGGPEKKQAGNNADPVSPKSGGDAPASNIGSPDNPVSGGSISQLPAAPSEKNGETLSAAEVAQANKAAFDQVSSAAGTDAAGRPIFDSSRVSNIESGPVRGGSGERSIATTDTGAQAHIYTNVNDAKAAYNNILNTNPNVSVSAFAEAKIAGQDGAHFVVSPKKAPAAKPEKPGGIAGGGRGGTNTKKQR